VYPLYWIITLVLLPAYFLVPGLGAGHESHWRTILHSLLLIPQEHSPILAVGWSLCYEVFFYALFGLTILLPFGMSLLIISFWIAGSIVNTVIESVFLIKSHFILQFCFSFHTLEFILGCLVAWLIVCRFRYRGAFLFILGCTLFSLAGISQSHRGLQLHPAIAYGLPAGLILMGAATLDLKQTVKPPQFLSYLGDASYSIYLTHYPCLSATLKLALVLNLSAVLGHDLTVVVLGVIALAFGCLVYSTLELPIVFALRKQLLPQPNRNSCPTG
jgi:exopolysaccharide production protein ExoZ